MTSRAAAGLLGLTFAVSCAGAPPAPAPATPAATSSEVTGIAPKNAIVTLLSPNDSPAVPTEPAVLDQYAKQFVPTVLIARVGQPVEFRNSEDMPHNVAVTRSDSGTAIFNVGTEPHQTYVHTFDRLGQYDVKCDIHEGMEATVIVARGPLTAIAEDNGRFSLKNVAFGPYKLSYTFQGQTVEQPIEVSGARTNVKLAR
jgi:plastocyanin